MGGIQERFSEHMKEIQRRSSVAAQGDLNESVFERVKTSGNDPPFEMEDQKYMLFSMSHVGFAPLCEKKHAPSFRIYGTFPDEQSALNHARTVQSVDPDCSLLLNQTHRWLCGVATPDRLTDSEHVTRHAEALLELIAKTREESTRQFNENVSQHKTGEVVELPTVSESADALDTCQMSKTAHKIGTGAEVRGQRFVVLTIIPDVLSEDHEYLFRVYGCFETEDEANAYIRNVAGDAVRDYDIDIVSACEWVYPQQMTYQNIRSEVFRSKELDDIIAFQRKQPDEIRKLEATMEQR